MFYLLSSLPFRERRTGTAREPSQSVILLSSPLLSFALKGLSTTYSDLVESRKYSFLFVLHEMKLHFCIMYAGATGFRSFGLTIDAYMTYVYNKPDSLRGGVACNWKSQAWYYCQVVGSNTAEETSRLTLNFPHIHVHVYTKLLMASPISLRSIAQVLAR